MFTTGLCVLFCSFTLQLSSADLAAEHSFFAALDENENVKLYWNVSTAKQEIYFAVEAKTTGWVGFGISSGQGKMKGADIVIGWVKDGQAYFEDRHAGDHEMPKIDEQQDYELISLKEDNGKTTMKFKRKLDTCDTQDNKIESGTTKVIYAYHPDDPTSENSIPQHSPRNRGPRSLLLLSRAKKVPTLPADTKTFDIKHNKTAISNKTTTYECAVFEIPKLNETHHIIKVAPVIQAGHEGVVHHMLLYECSDNLPKHHLNYTGKCYGSNMPPPIRECTGVSPIAGWAVGGQAFYYPEHVGFAIGKADSPKVVILEIHYDNPNRVEGMIDSSGFRFYYTKHLRQYEAGMIMVGAAVSKSLIIPPREADWKISGFCSADCTRKTFEASKLPDKGINIFSPMLHTHLAGRKAFLRHVRDGKELPEIARDNHYDFNFQEYHILDKEVHVAPGDSLITVCVYDTKDRDWVTFGGFSTYQEMCLSFLVYYPKVNLSQCESSDYPATQSWAKEYIKNSSDIYKPRFWTDTVNKGLEEAYRKSDKAYVFCAGRANQALPGLDFKLRPKPVIHTPYKPDSSCKETVSLGNRAVPGHLGVLITIMYLAALTA